MAKNRHEEVVSAFEQHGWSRDQALGLAANFQAESNFNPAAVGDGGKAYGLAQWHPDRQAAFQERYGKSIKGSTIAEQVAFANFELREGNERAAGRRLAAAKDAEDAARIVTHYYERPLDRRGDAEKRAAIVRGWLGTQASAQAADPVPAVAPVRQITAEAPARPEGWPVLPTAQRPTNAAKTAVVDGREALLAQSNAQAVAGLSSASVSQMETAAGIASEVDLQKQRDATGFGAVFQEARRDPRIQPLFGILDYVNGEKEKAPEGWTYASVRDEIEANHTDEEREYLRENVTGPQSLARAQAQIAYRREQDKVYGLAGGFSSFAGQMAGGAMDPVGFTLGMGVGKVLQGVGIGSAALASAGRVGAARTSFLAENALANVGVEAVQDALGEVKTSADYALAGATGVGMALPFVRGAGLTAADAAVRELTDSIKTQAVREQVEQVATHMDQTGNKDPLAAAKAVQDNELQEITRAVEEATRPNPIRDQVVPTELADEFRRIQEGEPIKVPEVEEPPRLPDEPAPVKPVDADAATNPDSRQLPELFTPEQLTAQVESIKTKGEFTREIPSVDGNGVVLKWFLKKEDRVKADKNTYSSGEVLQRLSEIGDDHTRRVAGYLNKVLSQDVRDIPIRFSTKGRGEFNPGTQQIKSPKAEVGGLDAVLGKVSSWHQSTAVHEIVHAATHSKIEAFIRTPEGLTKDLRVAMEQFEDLRQRYIVAAEAKYPGGAKAAEKVAKEGGGADAYNAHYATQNLHEFAAQLWSDKATRDILQGMEGKPVAGISSNAWREMINILAKILGFTGKDAYTEGSKLLDQIIQLDGSNITYMGGERALQAPGQVPPQVQASFARRYAEGLYRHAQQFVANNPIDTKRLNTLTAKIGGLSDGLVLASSKNPIMQMVASLVTETTTGAAGRKANVAIRSAMLNKKLAGNMIPDYQGAYAVWAKENGGTLWDTVMEGAKKREFDTAVYDEILNRRDPTYQPNTNASVVRAADTLEQFFDRGRIAQVDAGTLGSNNLAASSRGYIPQALDGNKLQALDVADLNLLHQALSKQFQDRLGWDAKFADMFAPYYTDRVRKRAQGSEGVDALSAGGDGSQVVRDTLEEMALDPTMRDRAAAANSLRAGMGHTKKRLDLDLREELRPGLRLADVYVTDPLALARSYGRRTAGTVALTESGIHGIRGVRQLREAAGVPVETGTTPTAAEFDAFDRVMAEILGTRVAGQVVSAGATNLALGVSLQRLGGLVFTQAAETFQLLHHLGLRSTLSGISSLPRMLGEVGRLKKGQASNNHILTSIEQYGGEIGTENYKMVAPLDAPDSRVEQYMEQAGVVPRLLRGGGHLQSKISGFRGLMAAQHRMAAEQITMRAARFIRDGGDDIALRDMGFTPDVVASMKADLPNVAKWDASGNLQSFDLTQVSDPRTAEAFVQAVHRGTSQIIQGTFIGERNKWMHNDYLRLMLQLRTFGLTAVEKQWGRTRMNHSYSYAAGLLLGQMALTLPIHMARVNAAAIGREDREKYLKDNLNPAALVRATMNYTSLSGLTGDVLEVGSGIVAGWGDNQTKELLGARQQATGVGRIVPVAGSIDTAIRVASGKSDLHTALKQLPFSNLWYIAPAINLTKD